MKTLEICYRVQATVYKTIEVSDDFEIKGNCPYKFVEELAEEDEERNLGYRIYDDILCDDIDLYELEDIQSMNMVEIESISVDDEEMEIGKQQEYYEYRKNKK